MSLSLETSTQQGHSWAYCYHGETHPLSFLESVWKGTIDPLGSLGCGEMRSGRELSACLWLGSPH